MNGLPRKLCGLALVVVVSGAICIACIAAYLSPPPFVDVGISHLIVLAIGMLALVVFSRGPVSSESILLATGIRTGGTFLLAGLLLVSFPQYRSATFVLSMAVACLAVLAYETWLSFYQLGNLTPAAGNAKKSAE